MLRLHYGLSVAHVGGMLCWFVMCYLSCSVPGGVQGDHTGRLEAPLPVQSSGGAAVQEQPAHAGLLLRRLSDLPSGAAQLLEHGMCCQ